MCNFYLMYVCRDDKLAYNPQGLFGQDECTRRSNFHESSSNKYDDVLGTRIPPIIQEGQQNRGYANVPSSTLLVTPSEREIDWHTLHGL